MSTQHERLVSAMKSAGKSWDDIKASLGLTRAGIKKWRDGNFKGLSAANVFALADLLRCDARWLAIGEHSDSQAGAFGEVRATWMSVNEDGRKELLRHAAYVASQDRFRLDTAQPSLLRS